MARFGRCTVQGAALVGVRAIPVDVEVAVTKGLPGFQIVGMVVLPIAILVINVGIFKVTWHKCLGD